MLAKKSEPRAFEPKVRVRERSGLLVSFPALAKGPNVREMCCR